MMDPFQDQHTILRTLLQRARDTAYAQSVGLYKDMSYESFASTVPLVTYQDLEPMIERCKEGEANVLWPGKIHRYAISSGTSGKGKHIPISDERITSDLTFMRGVMWNCIHDNPDPGMFLGNHVALSGSVEYHDRRIYGEISGMLALESPPWIHLWYKVNPKESAWMSWSDRLELLIESNMHRDVRVLSGVPSWLLIFIREVSRRRKMPIDAIWPNLKLIVSGGVALSGYHDVLRDELGQLRPRFIENYGASEGYFASGFYDKGSMGLKTNLNIFYEFFEIDSSNKSSKNLKPISHDLIPLWEIKPNIPYGLVITTNSGLWRYVMNDMILFDSVHPPKIKVIGRLNEMTDTFGEALTSSEVYAALDKHISKSVYSKIHIQSSWKSDPKTPYHHWIFVLNEIDRLEYLCQEKETIARTIDDELISMNRHYAIRRETLAIERPQISFITFNEYENMLKGLNRAQSKLGLFI
jgi:hypothetical protein